ncbi:MAG: GyrI-like domain-containing protein [Planctomycetota bacterium]
MSTRHDTALDHRARLQRVLHELQRAIASPDGGAEEDLSNAALARVALMSRFHFSRVFRAMVGETTRAHIRRLRLERAATELARTDEQIVRIALRCGYNAHEPFTRAFAAHFGVSPTEYRNQSARGGTRPAWPPSPSGVHYGPGDAVERFVPVVRENPMLNVEIKHVPAKRVAAVEHIGEYKNIGQAFAKLVAFAGPRGLLGPGTECLGVFLDDPQSTPPEQTRALACVSAPPGFAGDDDAGVRAEEIPEGEFAVAVFKGPYERLDEAYGWLCGRWLAESGRELADRPPFEVYLNNPMDTKPEDLLTEIHMPLG